MNSDGTSRRTKDKPSPLAERLAREVHKIEAKLKAKGIPVPKYGSASNTQSLPVHRPATSSPCTTRPSTTDPAWEGGVDHAHHAGPDSRSASPVPTGSIPTSTGPSDVGRRTKTSATVTSLNSIGQPLSAEEELASHLTIKPPTLRLNLRGREANGQKPRPSPPPPPSPTPPPLTNVQRLDLLLQAHAANPMPMRDPHHWPSPDKPLNSHAISCPPAQEAYPDSCGAVDQAGSPVKAGKEPGLGSRSSSPQPMGAGAHDWAGGVGRAWSPMPDARAWSAVQASDVWITSPMQLRGSLLAGLGEVQASGMPVQHMVVPGSPTAGAGRPRPMKPGQRVDQAVQSVALGAIALRAERPEQVVTMQDHSNFLTTMWPVDPYSRDPVRISMGAVPVPQTASTFRNRSMAGIPMELGDGFPNGSLIRRGAEDPPRKSTNGLALRTALLDPANDLEPASPGIMPGTRFACDEEEEALEVPSMTLRQLACTAVLGELSLESFSPRANRHAPLLAAKRATVPLDVELVDALAPGDPGTGRVSRAITPVQDEYKSRNSRGWRDDGLSLKSGWGRSG